VRDLRFVRDQQRFDTVDELLAQMNEDMRAVAYPSYG
jgi:FAD synthase